MSKALCSECQFLYDSRIGLPESNIPPGTPFQVADDSLFFCPQCGASKDIFMEVKEMVIEVDDPRDLSELEAQHVPIYFIDSDENLVVHVGNIGSEHSQDSEHMIEWIGIFDESDEIIDCVYFHPGEECVAHFSIDLEDFFEVRAACSEHGIWKGISYESTGL